MADTTTTVDELSLKIQANADGAVTALERLTATLENMATKLAPAIDSLKNINTAVAQTATSANSFKGSMSKIDSATDVTKAKLSSAEKALLEYNKAFSAIKAQQAGGQLNPISNNFTTQIKIAEGQLNRSISQLRTYARESDTAFEGSEIQGYVSNLTRVRSELNGLKTQYKDLRNVQNLQITSMGPKTQVQAFAPAPITQSAYNKGFGLSQIVAPTVNTSRFSGAMAKIRSATQSAEARVSKFANSVKASMDSTSKSANFLGETFIQLRSKIFFAMFALGAIGAAAKATIGQSVAYVETLNLFNVAMQDNIQSANQFVNAMTKAFGLDPERVMRYQATFYQVAESMGVAKNNAYTLSTSLTQLTFDIASLRNMSFDETFTKMQAILTGQDKAIRSLGGSIQMTTLQEEAHNMGIKTSIKSMTQAEKSLLRLIVFYKQSAIAQGDMGRTLMQPANLLRVLGDQFAVTARAIGALFIPMIRAVLPYIIYFVVMIGKAARALASFFGIKTKASDITGSVRSVDGLQSGLTGANNAAKGLGGSTGKVADNTKKAADNLKKMKDYTLGIDELNILQPQTSTATGSAGGGGGVGGGGLSAGDMSTMNDLIQALSKSMEDLIKGKPFADMMKNISDKVKSALKSLAPFNAALKDLWKALLPFLGNIWQGMKDFFFKVLVPLGKWTMNTVGVAILKTFTVVLNFFNAHPALAKAIGAVIAALWAIKGLSFIARITGTIGGFLLKLTGFQTIPAIIKGVTTTWSALITAFKTGSAATALAGTKLGFLPSILVRITATARNLAAGFQLMAEAAGVSTAAAGGLVAAAGAVGFAIGSLLNKIPAVQKAQQSIADWIVKITGAGKGTAELGTKLTALGYSTDKYGNIVDKNGVKVKNFGNNGKRAINSIDDAMKILNGTAEDTERGIDGLMHKSDSYSVAQRKITEAQIANTRAQNGLTTAQKAYNEAIKQYGKHSNEAKSALADLKDAELAAKDAKADLNTALKNGKPFEEARKAAKKLREELARIDKLMTHSRLRQALNSTSYATGAHISGGIRYNATGSMNPSGSLFIAGEAGPELVGSYGGNNSTVMPLENSGFVSAMSKAVYGAVASAMSQYGSGGGSGDVYLDGDKVGAVMDKNSRRKGTASSLVTVG